jgi:pSer/pThr/pTyr-binding forkhead associated (FHA) protein
MQQASREFFPSHETRGFAAGAARGRGGNPVRLPGRVRRATIAPLDPSAEHGPIEDALVESSSTRMPPPSSSNDAGSNRRTMVVIPNASRSPRPSFAQAFHEVFPRLDDIYRAFPRDGLLVAAVWEGAELDAYVHVGVGADTEFLVIGRHSRADLYLGRDQGVSLRHALVGATRTGNELRLRLVDLQSGGGLHTEDGGACEALAADGAVLVRLGGYQLFLLPTGSLAPLPWGRTPEDAWNAIPERVYLDRRIAARVAAPPEATSTPAPPRRTIATHIIEPPTALRQRPRAPGARGARVGAIELAASGALEAYPVHEADLDDGVLIGRYERCSFGADDERLSRVHLLVVRDGNDLWAVDTSSTNGTTAAGTPVRQLRLGERAELLLGKTVTLRWSAGPA